jgi:hypothetical protein
MKLFEASLSEIADDRTMDIRWKMETQTLVLVMPTVGPNIPGEVHFDGGYYQFQNLLDDVINDA